MANYRPLISWTNVNDTTEYYYYDADQIQNPTTQLAIGINDQKVTGTSVGLRICSAVGVNNTFIRRVIVGGLEEYYGLTSYNNVPLQSFYPNYTFRTNPIYYYQTNSSAPNKDAILSVGDGVLVEFHTSIEALQNFSNDLAYVSLYGGSQQIDFLMEYAPEVLNPKVDWRVYLYNPSGSALVQNRKYDITINWDFITNSAISDYFEVEEINISLIPYQGTSPILKTYIYTLPNIPNTFSIPKNIAFPLPFVPTTVTDQLYNLNLYAKYKRIDTQEEGQTDRFSTTLSYYNQTVQAYENATTRIDNNDKSTITFIMSAPEDDENYEVITIDSDDSVTPSDIDSADIVSNVGCGANMYAMTKGNFSALVRWLWSSTFIDNIKLINNSPIENIISAKLYPFTISSGSDTTITLGNVDTPIQGEILPVTFNNFYRMLVSSYTVEGYYGNFLDYAPYTTISIYLPYIGIKELDTSMIVGKTLKIFYTFDLCSGAVVASVYVDGNCLYMFEGVIGVDLPLSASNRAQVDATYVAIGASSVLTVASTWIGAGSSIAAASEKVAERVTVNTITSASIATAKTTLGSLIDSAHVQFHTTTEGNFSPNTWGLLPKEVYMIYNRPTYQDIDTFRHVEGRHCMLSRYIKNLRGYTEVHSGIDLSGIPCDEELKARLKAILVGGFIA